MTHDDDNIDKLFIYLNDLKRLSTNLLPLRLQIKFWTFLMLKMLNGKKVIRCSLSPKCREGARQLIEIRQWSMLTILLQNTIKYISKD